MGGIVRLVLIAIACIALVAYCSNRAAEHKAQMLEDRVADARADAEAEAKDDVSDAQADAKAELSTTTYEDQVGNVDCTEDCSGHDAGYQYAIDNDYEDASDCDGNSQSFIEGCEAYVEQLDSLTQEKLEDQAKDAADAAEDEVRANS